MINRETAESLAARLLSGELSTVDFAETLAAANTATMSGVTLDLDRQDRCGFPEVIYGEGKSAEMLRQIFQRLLDNGTAVLATRIGDVKAASLCGIFPSAIYNAVARTLRIKLPIDDDARSLCGNVSVVTAGSSDLPVAEEARETLDWMGISVTMIHDVGVAGPNRLPVHLATLRRADAIVVVAGMEGALPSVVGGYVNCPVVAVPTSVGYGANFAGIAALLGMLNSCASNVSVVNIDAGFKGAYVAGLIARNRHMKDRHPKE